MTDYASMTLNKKNYPKLLREIHDPPRAFYYRGSLDLGERKILAVVGSRKATTYGREAVKQIVEPLAAAGIVIVSGLAYGIDSAAHEAALAGKGLTIAVLGTAIDKIYPPTHTQLAERIIQSGGAMISEEPPGATTYRTAFPKRNRIIAGLAHATLVVEAAFESGSLITARLALEENRDVFVVPGPITSPTSAGTNNLLKLGARPVTEANDILSGLGEPLLIDNTSTKSSQTLSPVELTITDVLSRTTPLHIDKLQESVTIDLPELQSQLTLLEIRGVIRMTAPGWYVRI